MRAIAHLVITVFQVLSQHSEAGRPASVGLPKQRDEVGLERREGLWTGHIRSETCWPN